MQLSRCKNSKLTIEYTTHFCQDLDARRCECFDFWTMVLKKHEKIHKVMLSYDVAHGDAQLFDLLGGLSFPLLRTLILTSNITTHWKESFTKVCKSWIMPELMEFQGIHCRDGPAGLGMSLGNSLKRLHLTVGQWGLNAGSGSILQSLASTGANNVEELHLVFHHIVRDDVNHNFFLTMPRVRKITLEFLKSSCGSVLHNLIRHIKLPEVTDVVGIFHVQRPKAQGEMAMKRIRDNFEGFPNFVSAIALEGNNEIDEVTIVVRDGVVENENARWYAKQLKTDLVHGIARDINTTNIYWALGSGVHPGLRVPSIEVKIMR